MSPRTKQQNEGIRQEKRRLIMDVAMELFAREGFHGTPISKIAKKAKISKGLLYNYFESKEALLIEMINDAKDKSWVFFDPDKDGVLTSEEFYYFIRKTFQATKENHTYWRLFTAVTLQDSTIKIFADIFDKEFSELNAYSMKLLTEFFKERGCKDPEGEYLLFVSLMKGATIQYIFAADKFIPINIMEMKIIDFYKERLKH